MPSRKVQTLKYGLNFFAYTCTFLGEGECSIIIIVIVCVIVRMHSIMLFYKWCVWCCIINPLNRCKSLLRYHNIYIYIYIYIYMCVTRLILRKATLHAHNIKTHFSPSNDTCSNWPTIQAGIDAESCLDCFCCGLFLRPVRCPRMLGMSSNGYISPWQADSLL